MEPVVGIEPTTCCLRMVTAADLKTSKNQTKTFEISAKSRFKA